MAKKIALYCRVSTGNQSSGLESAGKSTEGLLLKK